VFFEKRENLFVGRFPGWFDPPGPVHGFSTRRGGISVPPYASLNLGLNTDDSPGAVEENLRRFCAAMGIRRERIAFTKQVHGDGVLAVRAPGVYEDTDALVTDVPGLILAVQVADCVPVFLFDPVRKAAGMVHAGWKGSALDIAVKTVVRMSESFGSRPETLQACIGPSIGPCCYEVGAEAAERFPSDFVDGNKLDLWRYNYQSLVRYGLTGGNVSVSGLCTACHSDWFFSHRAGGGKTGRMMGMIGMSEED
jgi:polyphenol oxidase